jgi:hypothetical protein
MRIVGVVYQQHAECTLRVMSEVEGGGIAVRCPGQFSQIISRAGQAAAEITGDPDEACISTWGHDFRPE